MPGVAKVLLVEDAPLQMMVLQGLPCLQGHDVACATTIAEATPHADADVAVLDAHLPDGDFAALLAALKGAGFGGTTLGISARPEAVDGASHVVDKLDGPEAINSALQRLLVRG